MPTPNTITLTPNRGRDYPSAARVLEHLKAGHDFIVADMSSQWDGKPCNVEDLKRAGVMHAKVRYDSLRKVTVVNILEIT
jgi:hypothetical protein